MEAVTDLLQRHATATPTALAVLSGERAALTYADVAGRVSEVGEVLRAAGIAAGDTVAVVVPESVDTAILVLAISAFAACAPINPAYNAAEFESLLKSLRANSLVVLAGDQTPAKNAAERLSLPVVELTLDPAGQIGGYLSATTIAAPKEGHSPTAVRKDAALLLFTSGTSARPRLVPLTHANLAAAAVSIQSALELTAADRCLGVMPLYHIHGLSLLFATIAAGGSYIGMSGFTPDAFYDALRIHRPTWYSASPTIHRILLEQVTRLGGEATRSGLRFIRSASAPMPPTLIADIERAFGVPFIEAYGMTEAAPQIASNRLPPAARKPGSVGIASGPDVAILDDAGQLLPAGGVGEIAVRGANVMAGYVDDAEANHRAWTNGWLRTGDLGHLDVDGYLFVTGRLKEIINRGGEKISPRKVDDVLSAHPAVAQAATFAVPHAVLGEDVAAAVVLRSPARDPQAMRTRLREFAAERLAAFEVPHQIVLIDAIPLGPAGKLIRGDLAEKLGLSIAGSAATVASSPPRTPTERRIAQVFAEVLRITEPGRDDDFFAIGGHSLAAMQVVTRVNQIFHVALPMDVLFRSPTISELATVVAQKMADMVAEGVARLDSGNAVTGADTTLPRRSVSAPAPLSFPQQRLYFLDQMGAGGAYHMAASLRLNGECSRDLLVRCLSEIVRRHESLRTVFRLAGESPVQIITEPVEFSLPLVDLTNRPSADRENAANQIAIDTAAKPFDLAQGPLFRATLVRLAGDDHVLLLQMHHIISDGWSVGVLHDEFAHLYAAFAAGQPSPLLPLLNQYADFAAWQRSQPNDPVAASQLSYWTDQLRDAPPVCTFPAPGARPAVQTYRGATHRTLLPRPVIEKLSDIGAAEKATPFMVLLAAFQTLLFRCNAQDDCTIGTPIANRSRKELEPLIGFFANTLVLRTSMAADPLFTDLLARVRTTALGAYAHPDVPLERIVEELRLPRDPAHTPLFQVMFAYQNLPDGGGDRVLDLTPQLSARRHRTDSESAKFDLTLYLSDSHNGLMATWQYNADLYDPATVQRLAAQFTTLLEGIAANPRRALSALPLMTDAERYRAEVEWNDTAATRTHRQNFLQLFDKQAERTPEAVAVTSGDTVLTYRELHRRSQTVARALAVRGVTAGTLVGVCLARSADYLSTILGIWRAGAAFLPLDPNYPASRIAFMCADAGAAFLLAEQSRLNSLATDLSALPGVTAIAWDAALANSDAAVAASAIEPPSSDTLAYVIYTSGSTGRPKGVMITHGNVCHYAQSMGEALGITAVDRYLHTAPFGFSSSVRQFVVPLAAGAAVVIAPSDAARDPLELLGLASRQAVTVIDLVPSLWTSCLQVIGALAPAEQLTLLGQSIRLALSASEPLPASVAKSWHQLLPQARQINMFGQTETTGIVSTYAIPHDIIDASTIVPIGRPIANTRAYVLDPNGQIAPVGIAGELYIGGDGVGRGYTHQPELTARNFSVDPFSADGLDCLYRTGDLARYRDDGVLEFLGRRDGQVKVRGFRIEPGEVESVATQFTGLKECAVLPVADTNGHAGAAQTRLIAFVSPHSLDAVALRNHFRGRLPDYMVPQTIRTLPQLPRTISGKVDRAALLAALQATPCVAVPAEIASAEAALPAPPRSEAERILADVWKQVLHLDHVGVDQNFFDLGGNSLVSISVIVRAKQAGLPVTLAQLYQNQTIADLARVISSDRGTTKVAIRINEEEDILATAESLRAYGQEALTQAGLDAAGAAIVTEVQLEASLRGQPTHHMVSIPRYAKRLATGKLNKRPNIRVEHETATSITIDGDNGPGQWVATVAMQAAIRKAKESGIGMVSVRRSNHFGAAGQYVWHAAAAGLIGLCTTNGPLILAPTGGVRATFGNNPVGVGIPAGERFPILLDIAMSVAPRGRIGLAVAEGRPLTPGWILDKHGRPTTDLADLAAGLGVPIGAHKGYGLALVMEIFSGVLSGAGFCADHHRDTLHASKAAPDFGHFFMAIDPQLFMPSAQFARRVDALIEQTKSGPLAEGATEILVPGEPELRARERSLQEGVRLQKSTYRALLSYAKDVGLKTQIECINRSPVPAETSMR
ncbi:MAG: putative linear pentadecapeptide gramicidin synthetase LgrB [Phycisphaerales bacterium]|nr:putative linear pentadecapeptide gramicidin synthetase LgrB [Phycisphaerales bacterium]